MGLSMPRSKRAAPTCGYCGVQEILLGQANLCVQNATQSVENLIFCWNY